MDGWDGPNTTEALNFFLFRQTDGRVEMIERTALDTAPANLAGDIPQQRDLGPDYGTPGDDIKSKLVIVELPYKLRIDGSLRQSTNEIRVPRKASGQLEAALIAVREHYGADRMKDLGIDRYGGAYNHRRMRGSTQWSMHAYGCAIDFCAVPSGLRTPCPKALFCGAEYKDFLDIIQDHEWLAAIRLWKKDAMHFQRALL